MEKNVTSDAAGVRGFLLAELRDHFAQNPLRRLYVAKDRTPPVAEAILSSCHRIAIPLSGSHPMLLSDGREIEPQPGEAVLVTENAWNRPRFTHTRVYAAMDFRNDCTRFYRRNFTGSAVVEAEQAYWFHTPRPLAGAAQHVLSALVLVARRDSEDPTAVVLAQALVRLALDELAEAESSAESLPVLHWRAMTDYMRENLEKPLTRASVAEAFSLHPNHLSRIFSARGEGFKAFLQRIRMERASHLLRIHRLPAQEVASRCGFADPAYFRKAFFRHFGTPPEALRGVPQSR